MAGEQRQQPHEKRPIVIGVYHGAARGQVRRPAHPPARGGGRGPPAEPGVEGLAEGGADPHAPQCDTGGDRRAVERVPAHDLAGRQGPDGGDRPNPGGSAAHGRGGAPGLRPRGGRHPLPLLEPAKSPRIVVAVSAGRPA